MITDDQGGGSFKDVWGVERFGFAYGTLPCHLVAGEERFVVEWDKTVSTPSPLSPLTHLLIAILSAGRHGMVRSALLL
jgi:hypothetical protein